MNPIKAKIQELCPNVMELKFGCEVEVQNYVVTISILQDRRDWTWIAEHGQVRTDFVGLAPSGVIHFENHHIKQVLGSPITLAVVLRAILAVNAANRANVFVEAGGLIKVCHWEGGRHLLDRAAEWNLTKDNYDDQTEETKKFIGSLLGV